MSAKSAAAVPTVEAIVTLAASYDLAIDPSSVSINEAGLDYRVAFANARDGQAWVLRMPRRPDVSAKLEEEARILEFVAPRLSVAVPQWAVYNEQLIAYPRLPGKPGLTLDEEGQPVWHFEPTSSAYAVSLGTLIAALHSLNGETAAAAGVPALSASEVREQWRSHLETVQAEFEIAQGLLSRWHAWLANDELWPRVAMFTHGELYPAHVLMDERHQILGVLDWTTAKISDPAIDFTYQYMMAGPSFELTVRAYVEAGGAAHPKLPERCAEIIAAGPIVYGLYALQTGQPEHRASAAAQLNPQNAS